MAWTITVNSALAIERKLKRLPENVQRKVIRSRSAKTGTSLKKAMQEATPVESGALRRAWGKSTRTDRATGRISTIVGIRARWADSKTGKIPNLYAARVDKHSKGNKGFARRAFGKWVRGAKGKFTAGLGSDIEAAAKG